MDKIKKRFLMSTINKVTNPDIYEEEINDIFSRLEKEGLDVTTFNDLKIILEMHLKKEYIIEVDAIVQNLYAIVDKYLSID